MTKKLLIVDDDVVGSRLVERTFGRQGFTVLTATSGNAGLAEAIQSRPDVVLLDLHMPGLDGMEVLVRLKALSPSPPVIMLTASDEVRSAVRAIQLGAFHYLTKPYEQEELMLVVRRALEAQALRTEVQELRKHLEDAATFGFASQVGQSPRAIKLVDEVHTVASSDFTVLVLGETGTGKELVAQAIHKLSARVSGPFVALDCGAIPETLMESELFGHEKGAFTGADRRKEGHLSLAAGGTCFLDEIGNMPTSIQAKLLRVLESRRVQPIGGEKTFPVDVRFVAATNDDLHARAAQGRFRSDLYYRLAQYVINLPPLRHRVEDIPFLAQRFVDEASVELRRPILEIESPAMDLLQMHSWPGNVRELRNVVRRLVLTTNDLVIREHAVRSSLNGAKVREANGQPRDPSRSLKQVADDAARAAERSAILSALQAAGGNKAEAARQLKTDYKTLHIKIKALGLETPTPRPPHEP